MEPCLHLLPLSLPIANTCVCVCRYLMSVTADGLVNQLNNPEVDVESSLDIRTRQILMELRVATHRLTLAHQGVDTDTVHSECVKLNLHNCFSLFLSFIVSLTCICMCLGDDEDGSGSGLGEGEELYRNDWPSSPRNPAHPYKPRPWDRNRVNGSVRAAVQRASPLSCFSLCLSLLLSLILQWRK